MGLVGPPLGSGVGMGVLGVCALPCGCPRTSPAGLCPGGSPRRAGPAGRTGRRSSSPPWSSSWPGRRRSPAGKPSRRWLRWEGGRSAGSEPPRRGAGSLPVPPQPPTRDGFGAQLRDEAPGLDHLHLQLPAAVGHAHVDVAWPGEGTRSAPAPFPSPTGTSCSPGLGRSLLPVPSHGGQCWCPPNPQHSAESAPSIPLTGFEEGQSQRAGCEWLKGTGDGHLLPNSSLGQGHGAAARGSHRSPALQQQEEGTRRGTHEVAVVVLLLSHLRCPARTYASPAATASPALAALWPQGGGGTGKGRADVPAGFNGKETNLDVLKTYSAFQQQVRLGPGAARGAGEGNEVMVQGTGVPWSLLGITVMPWGQLKGVQLPPSLPSCPTRNGAGGRWDWVTVLQELWGQEVSPHSQAGHGAGTWGCPGSSGGAGTGQPQTGVAASHARLQHVPSSEGSCQEGSWGWCTCGTLIIPLPQPRVQHGPPPMPPALTHRGGGQRLPPHQLPRPQPVEEVTELALGAQPRGGEYEPVWDGAERCHGAPPCAGHVPQRPRGPLATPRLCARSLRAVGAVAVGAAVGGLAAALPGDPGPHLHRDAGLGAPPDVAAQLFGASLCKQRCGVSTGSQRWRTAAGGAWPEQSPGTTSKHQSHSTASPGGSGLSSADLGLPHRSSAHPGAGWGRDLGTSRAAFACGCVQPSAAVMLPSAAKSCRALSQPRPNSSTRPRDEGSAELPPQLQHQSLLWRSSSCGTGAAPLVPSAVPRGRSPKPLSASSGVGSRCGHCCWFLYQSNHLGSFKVMGEGWGQWPRTGKCYLSTKAGTGLVSGAVLGEGLGSAGWGGAALLASGGLLLAPGGLLLATGTPGWASGADSSPPVTPRVYRARGLPINSSPESRNANMSQNRKR